MVPSSVKQMCLSHANLRDAVSTVIHRTFAVLFKSTTSNKHLYEHLEIAMRTSLLCIGMAVALAGSSVAQNASVLLEMSNRPHRNTGIPATYFQTPPVQQLGSIRKETPTTQGLTYTTMYRTDFTPQFEIFNENKVYLYDSKTKTVALMRTNRVFPSGGGNLTGGQIRLYTTSDNGATWNETEVYNKNGKFLAFPQFGLVNPQGTGTNFNDLNWSAFCSLYEQQGTNWNRTGEYGLFSQASGLLEIPMLAPENAPSDMGWSVFGDLVSVKGPSPSVFHVDRLNKSDNNGPSQYGMYGTWGYDFDVEDFTASTIPSAWTMSQFAPLDPPNLNSTLNSAPRIGADANGTVYMAANLIFASEPNKRVPAVSTTNDQGGTWSDFIKMPSSVLDAYATSRGWANIQTYGAYEMDAFVVTGPNKWSYIYRVGTTATNSWQQRDLVEAKYDNGTWTMTKIADINGFPLQFARQDSISDLDGPNAWVPSYSLNDLGHEVEVAITADGANLLVKWIDDNSDLVDSGFTQRVAYQNNSGAWIEDQMTGIAATDVYISYRAMNSNSWTEAKNITQDRAYDHGTRIPPIIESLTSVPFLSLKTMTKSEFNQQYQFYPALSQLPDMILAGHVDYRTPNNIQTAFFNATVTSVSEEQSYNFSVNGISPNPTNNNAELSFTMNQAGNVSIDVISVAGNKIATVLNSTLDAGIHGITIPTTNLANGAYYVSVGIGTQRITRQLVVMH